MELNVNKCVICASRDKYVTLFKGKDRMYNKSEIFTVVKCINCNHVYTRKLPGELKSYYEEKYYAYQKSTRKGLSKFLSIVKKVITKEYYGDYRIFIPIYFIYFGFKRFVRSKNDKKLSILDVGCGDGSFLNQLSDSRWEKYGNEISELAVISAQEKGIKTFLGDLESAKYSPEFFDVIRIWHVLEHIPNPNEFLKEIQRILKKDGIFIVSVPNINSLQAKIFKENWFDLDLPRHVNHFSYTTLKKILEHNRFIVQEISSFSQFNSILNSLDYYLQSKEIRIKSYKKVFLMILFLVPLIFLNILNKIYPEYGNYIILRCQK